MTATNCQMISKAYKKVDQSLVWMRFLRIYQENRNTVFDSIMFAHFQETPGESGVEKRGYTQRRTYEDATQEETLNHQGCEALLGG
jgi:hypothetical protein